MSQDGDIYADDQLSREDALAGTPGDGEVEDELDRGYSPPERESGNLRYGTTTAEVLEGESMEQRLEQEVPEEDPYAAAEATDVEDIEGPGSPGTPGSADDVEVLDDGEVGDERAGRLVEADLDVSSEPDQDLLADDAGIDGASASAEEAAVRVVPEDGEPL